ncbi:hypothetical protein [Burkholderia ubonensis]|uniref:hypothetical protein n=1 Tax=Burkholderia ubonensis TaxID=101571 RepID=UPI0012FF6591|nr:hypothetical protein [Burkholderia ubonensis]
MSNLLLPDHFVSRIQLRHRARGLDVLRVQPVAVVRFSSIHKYSTKATSILIYPPQTNPTSDNQTQPPLEKSALTGRLHPNIHDLPSKFQCELDRTFPRPALLDRLGLSRHEYGTMNTLFTLEEIMSRIIWGTIDKNGSILNGSGDFTVENVSSGKYAISFSPGFSALPGIVGSQNNYNDSGQANSDGVAFPFVNKNSCQANTGNSTGSLQNRSFAFIAIGN